MKLKESGIKFFIFPFIFLVFYIFIAAVPLNTDPYFLPIWIEPIEPDSAQIALNGDVGQTAFDIQRDADAFADKKNLKAFISGNRFGYFTEDGQLLQSSVISKKVSISSSMWTSYTSNATKTPIYHPSGKLLTVIDNAGFVHIDDNRIYLFEPGGNAVSRYDNTGKCIWRYLHTAPITAFNSASKGVIIGFSDGRLVCLDSSGTVRFDFYPGGSAYQVILGAALSEDGKYAVSVSGTSGQRVMLIHIEQNKHRILYHHYLEQELHKQIFVDFDKYADFAVFECVAGIGLLNCRSGAIKMIPSGGSITSIGHTLYKGFITVLTQKEKTAQLSIIDQSMQLIGTVAFSSCNAYLIQKEDKLFVASDTHIARFDIKGIHQ